MQLSGQARDAVWHAMTGELAAGRTIRLHVQTQSMSPSILAGDTITVERRRGPRIGDIVLVGQGDDWVVHRFLGQCNVAGKALAFTRGDNAHRTDSPVGADAILGTVVGLCRDGVECKIRRSALDVLSAWLFRQRLRIRRWGHAASSSLLPHRQQP